MALVFRNLWNIEWSKRDPTMEHLFLMGSPIPMLSICAIYLLFVFKLGPDYMKNRQPYNLKYVLLVYNLIQILLNFYNGIYALGIAVFYRTYDLGCMMPIPLDNPIGKIEISIIHSFYLLKILDLMDTVFFVLRKNYKQVTFLHVYHHTILVITTYLTLRMYRAGGHVSAMGILNMLVHGFMYSYYLLSAINKNLVWWKKGVTIFQIVQFIFLIVHSLWTLLMRPDCTYPKAVIFIVLSQAVIMLFLFSKFYWKNYILKSTGEKKRKE